MCARQLLEARAGVGDRREVRAVGHQRPEVREQRKWLDRASGLRGDDEERSRRRHGLTDPAHGGSVRGVEHVQTGVLGRGGEAAAQDLRRKRGATHAEQHHVAHSILAHAAREPFQLVHLAEHALVDRQPAQPVSDLRRALGTPQRRVARSQALADAGVRCCCDRIGDKRLERGGDLDLQREGCVAHCLDRSPMHVHRVGSCTLSSRGAPPRSTVRVDAAVAPCGR